VTEFFHAFVPSVQFLIASLVSLLLALGLFMAFRLADRYLLPILTSVSSLSNLRRWMPIIQTLSWVGFIIFALGYLVNLAPLPGLTLTVLLAIAFWQTIHNLAMGLLVRLKNDVRPGRKIQVAGQRGLITEMGLLDLEILNDQGQKTILAYRRIEREILTLENPFERIKSYRFLWQPETPEQLAMAEAEHIIQQEVLRLPWSIPNRLPIIEPVQEAGKQTSFRIVLYALDEKFFPDMIHRLEGQLKDQFSNSIKE
jgi:hypothetical protein